LRKYTLILGGGALIALLFVLHGEGMQFINFIPKVLAQVPPGGGIGNDVVNAAGNGGAAAAGGNAQADGSSIETIANTLIQGMTFLAFFLITVFNTLMWFLFILLDIVMNPAWIFDLQVNGQAGGLVNMLREIWQLCRDLVNLGLAFTLIAGGIQMIITADSSKIKEVLPHFVMALVLVNFSWFIPRVVFDVSQVLTYTVYQIPSLLDGGGCVQPPTRTQPARPCEIVVNYAFFDDADRIGRADPIDNPMPGWTCPVPSVVCIQTAPINSPEAQTHMQMHSGILNGLIVNHARLRTLIPISDLNDLRLGGAGPVQLETATDYLRLAAMPIKIIIVLLFHVALFFPLLALVAAFFLRIPILWITMAFMPLVALGYVVPDNLFGEFNPKKVIMEQFIGAVMLPVKVAVPFTIGFILVNAGSQSSPPDIFNQAIPLAVFSDISSLWQIMWMIIALFIIWKYSFEALKGGGEMVNLLTDKIKGFGDATLELAKKAPLSVPFIPLPGGGTASPLELGRSFSPRQALAEIDSGHGLRGPGDRLQEMLARRRAGGTIHPESERAAEVVRNNTQNIQTTINTNIRNFTDPTQGAVHSTTLQNILKQIRAADPRLLNVSAIHIVEGILHAMPGAFSPEQRAHLLAAAQNLPPPPQQPAGNNPPAGNP
jgi:hypothetical protein